MDKRMDSSSAFQLFGSVDASHDAGLWRLIPRDSQRAFQTWVASQPGVGVRCIGRTIFQTLRFGHDPQCLGRSKNE